MSKKLTKSESTAFEKQIERDLAININLGYMKITGHTPDGKPLFALTEKGIERVESLMKKPNQK